MTKTDIELRLAYLRGYIEGCYDSNIKNVKLFKYSKEVEILEMKLKGMR